MPAATIQPVRPIRKTPPVSVRTIIKTVLRDQRSGVLGRFASEDAYVQALVTEPWQVERARAGEVIG